MICARGLRLALLSGLLSAAGGCAKDEPAPGFDPKVAPPPPAFSIEHRIAMAAELGECACEHVFAYVAAMDGYADQMRRFRGE